MEAIEYPVFNSEELIELLPHKGPALTVAMITDLTPKTIVAKAFAPFVEGHFPGNPIARGVDILESMTQCAALIVLALDKQSPQGLLLSKSDLSLMQSVRPHEWYEVRAQFERKTRCGRHFFSAKAYKMNGRAFAIATFSGIAIPLTNNSS